MPRKVRDYKDEYKKYHSRSKQKKRRAGRNQARRAAMRAGRVRKGDGKDIDHHDNNPRNNKASNLRVKSKSANRSFKRNKRGGVAKRRRS